MKTFVTGFNHLSGKSKKTGNDYDFYPLEILSKRNSGHGATLMASVVNIQAQAFENILGDFINEKSAFPVYLNLEFDAKGGLVDADKISDGEEAAASIVDTLCG